MTREIKFRAFGEASRKMIDWVELQEKMFWWDNDSLELMQFTGLTAKNGREIYEGDVGKDKNGELREVIWFADEAKFFFKFVKEGEGRRDFVKANEFEIIGNICENPELLAH